MANELTISQALSYSKSNDTNKALSFSDNVDVSGSLRHGGVQTIGTSEESLVLGDVSSVGWVTVKNLDDTNFVQIAALPSENFTIRLKAGEACMFRAAGNAIYAKADTASVKIAYEVFSD
jgi:hypothetical protein